MKLDLKLKKEPSDNIMLMLPLSLKRRWQQLRDEAAERGIDFHASAVDVISQFLDEFAVELSGYKPDATASSTRKRGTAARRPGRPSVNASSAPAAPVNGVEHLVPPIISTGDNHTEDDASNEP